MKDILTALKGDLTEYTSLPFWSWNNEIEPEELLRQIGEFKAAGIDGFIMHARTGLKTEYLGEKWFECVDACLKEARRLNMQAWVYDENGWPSGFVEGRLLTDEQNLVQYIEYKLKDSFDGSASYVYEFDGERARRLKSASEKAREYHCIYIKSHASFADILSERVVTQFIDATHEQYYKRFKDSFGRELAGFFTDEPQYFRWDTAYSRVLPEDFKREYGEDIADGLVYLFLTGGKAEEFRYKYYSLLNKLFTERFYKRIYDWCDGHNCKLTGHTVEETRLHTQMWCCAGAMPSYEYEHIPGIDWLARGIGDAASPKQVGSVAQQLGKKQVLTETFGCSGWDTTPRELRWITEFQYSNGVNAMCQHLCSYSLKGQAKGDYPPSFSRHNVWLKDSKGFNDYFKRLSYILCNTKERADTLVVHPIRSAYLTYDRRTDYQSVKEVEDGFKALTAVLTERGVQFHYGDESLMKKYARVTGARLVVGECAYENVIVPSMDNIDAGTLALLKEFAAAGGKLAFYGKKPSKVDGVSAEIDLTANTAFDGIKAPFGFETEAPSQLVFARRGDETGEYLYIFNSSKDKEARVKLDTPYRVLDLIGLNIRDGNGTLTVPPMESAMLMLDGGDAGDTRDGAGQTEERDITAGFVFAGASENTLTLDFAEVSRDGVSYGKPEYIHSINERLIKEEYNGKLWLKYSFTVTDKPESARLLFEQMKYVSLELNGFPLTETQSEWDVFFSEADLTPYIRTGKNEFTACIEYFQSPSVKYVLYDEGVMESLKNCVVIDTEIDSVYVKGGFAVDGNRAITAQGSVNGTDGLQLKGFPNFAGEITFKGKIDIKNKAAQTVLKLEGRYMTAAVRVNGRDAGLMSLSNRLDLAGLLQTGENLLEITVTSSMRNMMGPHHFAPAGDPFGVGHYHFDFRGTWKDGKARDFTEEYNLVSFGLEKIILCRG